MKVFPFFLLDSNTNSHSATFTRISDTSFTQYHSNEKSKDRNWALLWIVKFYNQKPKNKAPKMRESNVLRVVYLVDIINLPKIEIAWSKSIWLNFIKNYFFLKKVLPCSKTSKTKNFKKLITDSNSPTPDYLRSNFFDELVLNFYWFLGYWNLIGLSNKQTNKL